MANKIITIGNQNDNSSKYSLEVYRDISMIGYDVSKIKYINRYNCYLAVDGYNNEFLETEDGYIIETNYKHDIYTYDIPAQDDPTSSKKINDQIIHIDKLVNVKAIQNSLHNIFAWIPGERILNPEFGSKLYMYLYNGITDFTSEQIMAEIRNSVSQWEPRVNIIKVINVSDINDTENNTIRLDIIYTIPSLDDNQYRYSYTYNKTVV